MGLNNFIVAERFLCVERIASTRIAGVFLLRACQSLNRLKPIMKKEVRHLEMPNLLERAVSQSD